MKDYCARSKVDIHAVLQNQLMYFGIKTDIGWVISEKITEFQKTLGLKDDDVNVIADISNPEEIFSSLSVSEFIQEAKRIKELDTK